MNLISNDPNLGFNYFPTQKSKPNEPCVCLSTYSPKNDFPRTPLAYNKELTIKATILTVDHKGQN